MATVWQIINWIFGLPLVVTVIIVVVSMAMTSAGGVFGSWYRRRVLTCWPCGSSRTHAVPAECAPSVLLSNDSSSSWANGSIFISTTRFRRPCCCCLERCICRKTWRPKTSWRPPFPFCPKMRYVTSCHGLTERFRVWYSSVSVFVCNSWICRILSVTPLLVRAVDLRTFCSTLLSSRALWKPLRHTWLCHQNSARKVTVTSLCHIWAQRPKAGRWALTPMVVCTVGCGTLPIP